MVSNYSRCDLWDAGTEYDVDSEIVTLRAGQNDLKPQLNQLCVKWRLSGQNASRTTRDTPFDYQLARHFFCTLDRSRP